MRALVLSLAFAAATTVSALAQSADADTLVMQLKDGEVRIDLNTEDAPKHVERLKTLANQGFYDGLKFHRVIPGFMAQTGDPRGDGTGGSDLPDLEAEFSDAPFERGTVGMARSSNPNSANSQFFICFDDAGFLDGQYTAWGKVVSGMENVDEFARGEPPRNPDRINSAKVAADA